LFGLAPESKSAIIISLRTSSQTTSGISSRTSGFGTSIGAAGSGAGAEGFFCEQPITTRESAKALRTKKLLLIDLSLLFCRDCKNMANLQKSFYDYIIKPY
jgi:hypothetical protein